ncbi:hypothetical protein IIC68_04070 [archaeon]|nr:hypothetical protein [archaeon]
MPKPSNRPRAKRQKSMQPTYKRAGQASGLTPGRRPLKLGQSPGPTGRVRRQAKKR